MTWIEVVQCRHRASGWTTCHHDSACFLFYYIQNILYIFVSVILSTPAWKLMQPQNVAIRFFVKQTKKPMILQIQYIYGHMFTLKCVSQVRKHELSHSTNVWASFHRTLTSETAAIKNTSDRCALSSGSKSRDIMQIQRLQSNYESASFFLPLSTFRIEIMFFFFFSTVGPNSISIDSCASSEHCIEKYFWLFFFNLFFHGQVQQTLLPWRWPIWRIVFFFFLKSSISLIIWGRCWSLCWVTAMLLPCLNISDQIRWVHPPIRSISGKITLLNHSHFSTAS